MKITRQQRLDLVALLDHSNEDMSYWEGGTFIDRASNISEPEADKKEMRSVRRAHNWIINNILTKK